MRRFLIGTIAAIALAAALTQLLLPGRIAGDLEDRLERDGAEVEVRASAWPAATLLLGRGRSIDISGRGLETDLSRRGGRPFERLDGFARVELALTEVEVGPVEISRLRLERPARDRAYHLRFAASTTPRDLARAFGESQGGLLGGLAGSIAGDRLPDDGKQRLPFELDAELRSDGGRAEVETAQGSVAGLPTGPFAEIVVGAVLARI